mgnify:CR=1 FL=1
METTDTILAKLALRGYRTSLIESDTGTWTAELHFGQSPPILGHGPTVNLALVAARMTLPAREEPILDHPGAIIGLGPKPKQTGVQLLRSIGL